NAERVRAEKCQQRHLDSWRHLPWRPTREREPEGQPSHLFNLRVRFRDLAEPAHPVTIFRRRCKSSAVFFGRKPIEQGVLPRICRGSNDVDAEMSRLARTDVMNSRINDSKLASQPALMRRRTTAVTG